MLSKFILNKILAPFLLFFAILNFQKLSAQVSGVVFRDFNNNGKLDKSTGYVEPGAKGVIINAYNSKDVLIASYVSDSSGSYQIPISGSTFNGVVGSKTGSFNKSVMVRLEFIIPSTSGCNTNNLFDFSSYSGVTYGSNIRFVNGGAPNINYAINNPSNYVFEATPFSNTNVFLASQFSGNPLVSGTSSSQIAFWKFPYSRTGSTLPAGGDALATAAQIGSVYGVAFSKQANKIFTSAYMKRHSGFGPSKGSAKNAPGTIYIIDPTMTTSSPAATFFVSLDSLGYPTHNSSGTPNYGNTVSYSVSTTGTGLSQIQTIIYPNSAAQAVIGTNSNRGLANDINNPSNDPAAYGQIGTVSLGDIEISDDGLYLFVTNLYDRKVYQLQLNSSSNPTSASVIASWNLPDPPLRSDTGLPGATVTYGSETSNFYNGTKGLQRPFALKYYKGKVYVGATATGENGGVSITENNSENCEYTDLWSYIWELSPSNGFNATPIIQIPLNYSKGITDEGFSETWNSWSNKTPSLEVLASNDLTSAFTNYPSPMLTGIEVDVDGSLMIAFRDRFSDMTGYLNRLLTGTQTLIPISSGDLLRAYKNPTTCLFELEENGKEGANSAIAASGGMGNKEGPGKSATSFSTTNAGAGAQAWTNGSLTNVASENGVSTVTASLVNIGNASQHLQIKNLGLKIPATGSSGAVTTILGITSRIVRSASVANSITDNSINLLKAGSVTGTNKGTSTSWPIVLESATYGGASDLWGTSWTVAEVNASDFGLDIQCISTAAGTIPAIDYIEIKISYNISTTNTLTSAVTSKNYSEFSSSAKAGEFYYQDGWDVSNGTNSTGRYYFNEGMGSLTLLPGTQEITTTHADAEGLNTLGLSWMNNILGTNTKDYRVQLTSLSGGSGRCGGIGDIELFGQMPSIEIGNRVWNDKNGDGIQGADESGIANVNLEIYADFNTDGNPDGSVLGSFNTNFGGEYYFNKTNIADGDPTINGAQAGLQANKTYLVRLATSGTGNDWDPTLSNGNGGARAGSNLAGYMLTSINKAGKGQEDMSDNDASLVNAIPQISITTSNFGENNHSFDFGFDRFASIGDKVWRDDNNDGVQDTGEPGVAGVLVTLFQNGNDQTAATTDDILVGSTMTDAYGKYLFDNINPTNQTNSTTINQTSYSISFTLPVNYTFTTPNSSGDNGINTNSDVNIHTARTNAYNLSGGEFDYSADAGLLFNLPQQTTIGNNVWYDTDNNGSQNNGEPGLSDVTVTLWNAAGTGIIASTLTDADGFYLFTDVIPSSYRIEFSLPPGANFTSNNGGITASNNSDAITASGINFGKTVTFSISSGDALTYIDAGIISQPTSVGSIGEKIWYDNNRDGIQDDDEPGIANVKVTLRNSVGGTILATTSSNAFGFFVFNNLSPSDYSLNFEKPSGLKITSRFNGSLRNADSDGDPTTGNTSLFTLIAGQKNMTLDCGMYSSSNDESSVGSLGNFVWFDMDADGIQDSYEPGLAGITVTLYNSSNTAIATTTSDNNGMYLFPNLAPSNYSVGFGNLLPEYKFSIQNAGGNDAIDSDVNPSTNKTEQITVSAGSSYTDLDAGITNGAPVGFGTIGSKVWYDLPVTSGGTDGNGLQDPEETGVLGVTVELLDGTGASIDPDGAGSLTKTTTFTNAVGEYMFTGLISGSYKVVFSNLPTNFTVTSQHSGSNDAIDSDGGAINGGKSATDIYFLAKGEAKLSIDLGIKPAANKNTLGNYVWYDMDSDGIQDGNEKGLQGIMVNLYSSNFENAATNFSQLNNDNDGSLNFSSDWVLNGAYILTQNQELVNTSNCTAKRDLAPPTSFTHDHVTITYKFRKNRSIDDGDQLLVDYSDGTTWIALDTIFGYEVSSVDYITTFSFSSASIPGLLNIKGIRFTTGPSITGTEDMTLHNLDITFSEMASKGITVTNKDGAYLFTGLVDGGYRVGFSNLPEGYAFTTKSNTNNSIGSDADVSGLTDGVTLSSANRNDKSLDVGLVSLRTILGNNVWNDTNKDGIQNSNEPGLAGVTISLYDGSGNTLIASAISDENGYYLFSNLNAGNYMLGFTTIPSMIFTTKDVNSENLGTDSDVDPTTGKTTAITLSTTVANLNQDAGLYATSPANIGNYIWADTDMDGVQDADEFGVAGVLVTLFNSSNIAIGSSITNGNGYWQMTNVPQGTNYYLELSSNLPNFDVSGTPGSYPAWTTINVGTNGTSSLNSGSESNTDSDILPTGGNANKTGTLSIVDGNIFQNIDGGIINANIFAPVPVTWLKFKANLVNEDEDVLLTWSTASEINNSHFEAERSNDAKTFYKIGTIKSKSVSGYSSVILNYDQTDVGVNNLGFSTLYYRIRQVDYDGKFDYTPIEDIQLSHNNVIKLYPNPAGDLLNLRFNSESFSEKFTISISDITGRIVFHQDYPSNRRGTITQEIDIKHLDQGFYTIALSDLNNSKVFKFFKK